MEQGPLMEPEEVTTGVELIDSQHRQFLLQLAGLREAIIGGVGGRDRLIRTFRYLDEFIVVHFSTEENYMRMHNYPGILLHEREHEAFSRAYRELKQKALDLDSRGEILSFIAIEVEHQLERWLRDHILTMDKKMGAFLAERM